MKSDACTLDSGKTWTDLKATTDLGFRELIGGVKAGDNGFEFTIPHAGNADPSRYHYMFIILNDKTNTDNNWKTVSMMVSASMTNPGGI